MILILNSEWENQRDLGMEGGGDKSPLTLLYHVCVCDGDRCVVFLI